jgi:hypothetical protein
MRNTTLHSRHGRRPSGSLWNVDPGATESCTVSWKPTVNKDAPSSLPFQRAVIRGERNRAAGAGGSCRPDVAEVVRMQFEVFHPLTATTCVPVRPGDVGSCHRRDRSAVHAQAFARGIR